MDPIDSLQDTPEAVASTVIGPQEALGHAIQYLGAGDLASAEEMVEKILALLPEDPDTLHVQAIIRCEQRRLEEAHQIVAALCQRHPENSAFANTEGRVLWLQGQHNAARAAWARALELAPQGPEPYLNIAEADRDLQNYDAAIAAYEAALRLRPIYPKASLGLAQAHVLRDGWGSAIPWYQMAMAQDPENPNTRFQLSQALGIMGHQKDSVQMLQDITQKWPDHWGAWLNLAAYYERAGIYDDAFTASKRAWALCQTDGTADKISTLNVLVQLHRATATWEGLDALEQQLIQRVEEARSGGEPTDSIRPFLTLYTGFSAQAQRYVAERAARLSQPHDAHPRWGGAARAKGRLRVGYLIADVRNHPNAHNTLLMYGLHDRKKVEVFTYSWGEDDPSAQHRTYRRRIVDSSEHFIEMKGWADEAMAQRIAGDGIQVLVDLMGHTGDNRLAVLARRPAPIQVNYLGYPGTSGAEYVDYILGDRWVTPATRAEDFTEKVAELPWCYQINSHRDVSMDRQFPRSELDLPEEAFVFCCFNSNYKITPPVFARWLAILQGVPGSVLWLLRSNLEVEQQLHERAREAGIDPARVIFAPFWSRDDHLRRIQTADLFLDTTPYSAHTTASDALWAGVPVLTVPGDTFASRVAASLLHACHLDEGILVDWEAYQERAIALATTDRGTLTQWRERLRQAPADLPAFDTPALVRALESAYDTMWKQFQSGKEPRAFSVPR